MKKFIDRIVPYFPWIGLLLLFLGAASYWITRSFDLTTNLLLVGGALFLLLFALLRPDDVRRLFGRRQTRFGATTLLSIVLFAAIAILIFWIAYQNPDWRYDTTEEGAFTPLPETVDLLRGLEEPIHVIGFYPPSLSFQQEQAVTTLENMQAVTDRLSFEFQDPESNPLLAEQYDLNFPGTLVFIRNAGTDEEVFAKSNSLNDTDIHSALSQVINPTEKKAYFITGHGELDINGFDGTGMGTVIGVIEDQGFEVDELNLFTEGAVPEDASVVALIGQQAPLDPAESEALAAYVEGGGSLLLVRDPLDSEGRAAAEDDGVADMLRSLCGISLRNDAIIDQDLAQAGQEFGLSFIGDSYGTHPIVTEDLRLFGTRFVLARSVDVGGAASGNTELVRTSSNSWGETSFDLLSVGIAQIDGTDATGPLAVAAACESNEQGSRVVVVGDSDFVNNDTVIFGGNGLLFANSMNWLANDELAIELAPRETVNRQVNIPQTQLTLLQITSICLGPMLIALVGMVVIASRRRKR